MQPEVVAFMFVLVVTVFKIVELWIIWDRGDDE